MHKKHQKVITQAALKRDLSFLYAAHRHDLFYITVKYQVSSKYSERYSSYRADSKMFTDGWTPGSSLYPPNLSVGGGGDKNCDRDKLTLIADH